jgi:hypothetical protein
VTKALKVAATLLFITLGSQVHLHLALDTKLHMHISHFGQQAIHMTFVKFIQLQYVLPLSGTSRQLSIHSTHIPHSPPQALSIAQPRGKEVTSLVKVLASAGCDKSGEITEGKCVTGLEQVLQSPRLGAFSSMFLLGIGS